MLNRFIKQVINSSVSGHVAEGAIIQTNVAHGVTQIGNVVQHINGTVRGSVAGRDMYIDGRKVEFGQATVGSGVRASEMRTTEPFHSLEIDGPLDVNVSIASTCSVEVWADDNLIGLISTTVEGGELLIGFKQGSTIQTTGPMTLNITMPEIRAAALNGSGNVRLENVSQKELEIELRGSGDVVASGSVDSVEVSLQGSGDVDATRLRAVRADIRLQGSGDVGVVASERVKVRLQGSGDVTVGGAPATRDVKVAGTGDVVFS